ncbi:phage holin family protein [Vitreoscilla massiliensis]|uniref:Phage holin family protein n=1 Tax=Vitreoscilla massiliensis TaxID=1689272 RepID=A0ABY4E2Y4_9NEIS|nr:phage holin family protein [Vitreoscilla massiliensis]UOO89145.1 phage holin family protein [Vitreoscilla massiliensis]
MLDGLMEYKSIIVTWLMVIGLSMFGGLADAIMRYRREGIRMPIHYFLLKIGCDLFLSAFAGVIAYLGAWHFSSSPELSAASGIAIALSGYLGGNAINIFATIWEAILKSKTGGMQ